MKICVAQTRAVKGDIKRNLANHQKWIELAVAKGADLIIFPELSLTGYEPTLARQLATHLEDRRLDDLQKMSDEHGIIIGVGLPTTSAAGIGISLILFQPHQARQLYSKKYLHADEEPFFTSGENLTNLVIDKTPIALAICYELLVPDHAAAAHQNNARIYLASVAKSASGVEKAHKRAVDIARDYKMLVLMANSVGESDDFVSAGQSAIWDSTGSLLGRLNDSQEGILIIDTATQTLV
ncbi:carbon-nitrogen hydrolase family protein [Tellurirhabdus bombi]|uniref:carbon-nitrogen hydrolase family protein n=1 Tax=Tellurirhabdus bombi TaxID=2907205 RepID=UPI001F1C9E89|nr:carbon-nitrogen hydrolase family protein [Tellurirhabdus bombi]